MANWICDKCSPPCILIINYSKDDLDTVNPAKCPFAFEHFNWIRNKNAK